ncbi:ArsR family transcriptional regulator [Tamaricihabitans halophyticus]|uniref:ArsR family transcriptional regulator n=1 Tax=Tamaricihabitans halophyticus TaxID=1262583 RepID=A0A4R2QIG9_9PSEU|nr:helix-turn-helix domain-containing protein [Tamaricihabitans halophyticus]TCP48569.1 ArsR family transcriptional regulator [Tamaricihabitans halophyticus]
MTDGAPERISDPKKLRALAHPLRWRLIELLGVADQATATYCASELGESVASCSYHLNQLGKYGFVEVVESEGREKPWRLTNYDQSWSAEGLDLEGQLAAEAVSEAFLEHTFDQFRRLQVQRSQQPKEWREAAGMSAGTTFLTAEELAEVKGQLRAVIDRYFDRLADPGSRPAGARPVHLFVSALGAWAPEPDEARE